jgi:uncharacterized membrane protein
MKPLIVLLTVFVISLGATKLFAGSFNYSLSGIIAMSAMLLLTASGHFMFAKGMEAMVPSFIPFKKGMVFFTGIIEIAAATGLLIPKLEHLTAWLLIIFLIMILPANIIAAIRGIDYQKGTANGPGLNYLWFRVPLQLFFIGWVYFFAL